MKKYFALIFCVLTTTAILGQNVQDLLIESWTNGLWLNYFKYNYTYDESGFLIKNHSQLWDASSNTWKSNNQTTYTNNSNGNVIQYISQDWNQQSGSWVNKNRISYTYTSSNKTQTETNETWSDGEWVNFSKDTYTYDGDGNTTNVLSQLWETTSNTWKNSSQRNYTNNNGLVQQYIIQTWDQSSSAWLNNQRVLYSYNASNEIQDVTYDNISGNSWSSFLKSIYNYDASGSVSKILTQTKGSNTNWVNNSQVLYSNNSNGVLQQYTVQNWDQSSGVWINLQRGSYTYNSPNMVQEKNEIEFTCSPNPASDFITIRLSSSDFVKVSIMNLHGQVLSKRVENGNEFQIPINDLPKGIYIINLECKGKMGSYKFIKF